MSAPAEPTRLTTGAIARLVGGQLHGSAETAVSGVDALDDAGSTEITFVADEAHARRWGESRAAAALWSRGLTTPRPADDRPVIEVDNAEMAVIELLRELAPAPPRPEVGVHPSAWIHPDASVSGSARIGAHVSIDRDVVVADDVVLFPGVRLYPDCAIGAGSVLHANCVVRERCRIGASVILHQNVSIGADGFGYRPAKDGRRLVKVAHLGHVVIEDDVEIGAGTCVDRAKFGATVVGAGTKIDNLCQIGHNCRIGRMCVIAGLTGLAGSVVIEDGAMIGGHVGIAEHVRVGKGARIGAKSGVMRDVEPGQTVIGLPAMPVAIALRQLAVLNKLSATRKDGRSTTSSRPSRRQARPAVPGPGDDAA